MTDSKKLKINVPSDKIEARYSDFIFIATNVFGFNFDFAQRIPAAKQLSIVARIAMSPQHAKMFSKMLAEDIKKYEKEFGEIKIPKRAKPVRNSGVIHFTERD